jgi:dTDP-4-dehydrorhamnose 3,5-epimerase
MDSKISPASSAVQGIDVLLAKSSAVDKLGNHRQRPIDGVICRPTRPVLHEDGVLTEIARVTWETVQDPIVQIHLTTTLPGRIRAWGLHQFSTDRLFVAKGSISIVIYDGRLQSATYGAINEFKLSERNPALIVIPPNLYHGWKAIGTDEALIINMPTSLYNYDEPDALDLPYDSAEAPDLVPWRW